MTATKQQLIETRRELGKYMIVKVGGFEYEAFFGFNESVVGTTEHVSVHVNLVPIEFYDYNTEDTLEVSSPSQKFYSFKVEIRFNQLATSNLKEAEEFRRAANNAVKKVVWAQGLVRGLVWKEKLVRSFEAA